ncbi:hypothetical protein [Endozoicomonas euniceicola]|uniref:Ankyrin repeat protein n=1 Tax=Endozoicomonas euniceicola TaxID=1234143 RepID=A0ABY6GTP3_9GAMM|nr:hypothetical protein [Endozoicomonas euniceicola]UYM15759.1 hypothetical protein NX720_23510 [Endozoicomonas euniceicola]
MITLIIKRERFNAVFVFLLLFLSFQSALAGHIEKQITLCPVVNKGEELKIYQEAFKDIINGNIPNIGNLGINVLIKEKKSRYVSLLGYAVRLNKNNVALWLLDQGADPDGCSNSNYKKMYEGLPSETPPIISAFESHNDALLESLIEKGANPLVKYYNGVTAINIKKSPFDFEYAFKAIALLCENKTYEEIAKESLGYSCSEFIEKRNELEENLNSCVQGKPYFKAPVSIKIKRACISLLPNKKIISMLDQKKSLWNEIFGTDNWFWETLPSATEEIKSRSVLSFDLIRGAVDENNVELVKLILDTTNEKPSYDVSFPPILLASDTPEITRMLLKWGIRTNLGDRLSSYRYYRNQLTDFDKQRLANPLVEAVKKGHLENAKVLIEFGADPDHKFIQQMERHKITRDMALLLQFYKRTELLSYIGDETPAQEKKNIRLKKAVMAQDVFETAASLANGASPNTRLPDDHGNSNGDLLAEALILEKDQTEASISRLLLLYGAATDYVAANVKGMKLKVYKYEEVDDLLDYIHEGSEPEVPAFLWNQYIQDHELAMALDYFNTFIREKNEITANKVFSMFQRTAADAGVRIDEHPDVLNGLTACLNLLPAVSGVNRVWADSNSTPPFTTPWLNGTVCFEDNCEAVKPIPDSSDAYYETEHLPSHGGESGGEAFQPYCQIIDSLMSPAGKEVLRR